MYGLEKKGTLGVMQPSSVLQVRLQGLRRLTQARSGGLLLRTGEKGEGYSQDKTSHR